MLCAELGMCIITSTYLRTICPQSFRASGDLQAGRHATQKVLPLAYLRPVRIVIYIFASFCCEMHESLEQNVDMSFSEQNTNEDAGYSISSVACDPLTDSAYSIRSDCSHALTPCDSSVQHTDLSRQYYSYAVKCHCTVH